MRIAFFGGTFDPPHVGHLRVAQAAADALALDRVLLAPVAAQPLKATQPVAAFLDRFEMVKLLARQDPRLRASTLDEQRTDGRPNYTAETLEDLQACEGQEAKLFLLIGADSFAMLPQWHAPADILDRAELIVVSRPDCNPSNTEDVLRQISREAGRDNEATVRNWQTKIHSLNNVHEEVSASMVRAALAKGADCSAWLLPSVAQYIREHHLYTAPTESR